MKRTSVLAAILVVTTASACSADQKEQPMRTETATAQRPVDSSGSGDSGDRATNPAEPIPALVADADLIVTGTITDTTPADGAGDAYGPQTATIEVTATLKGDPAPDKLSITKPESSYFLVDAAHASGDRKARSGGVFVLRDGGDAPTLFGHVGVHDHEFAAQWFARALAGLPATLPPPTSDQLREWVAMADVIVFAAATGDAGSVETSTPRLDWAPTGTLEPIEALKGELPGPVAVTRGPQPAQPGGTWAFPVQQERTGVFFLDTSGQLTVINTAAPWDVSPVQVRQLLR
ncbi:hypothetical protein BLA60_03410 [Actinophytocola xinjiangensis]|uniref:Lipoprotein n=2 Tax=Actinophytocola xinjiangensis TaxID=485602 RepID=A0A7Z0WSS4_9PSEU|nr:hypothetical protein BLA60_03410 [Actinophytocola xinjiangensis]